MTSSDFRRGVLRAEALHVEGLAGVDTRTLRMVSGEKTASQEDRRHLAAGFEESKSGASADAVLPSERCHSVLEAKDFEFVESWGTTLQRPPPWSATRRSSIAY
ncbi:hypothetical protein DMN91_012672 [Ooceraea biroi]|uniref:Uncharacterized protein n=1 Tax=Ooceraea biroi TaxID=2015173 RepID=A0A3L8D2Q5_OOCBI|nr:hypothetical protein DMN91_012672 [Ooceraea biroi]